MSVRKEPSAYEARQADRAERLRDRAAKKRAEAVALNHKHDALLGVMNGSPVLRGHHSEGRHLRDLNRIDRDKRKSFDAAREADEMERRADAIEENRTISSDDPDAVEKLRLKLADIEKKRDLAKRINAAIGRRSEREAIIAALTTDDRTKHLSLATIQALATPDPLGNVGVPGFRVRNWTSEAKRIQDRITTLERAAAATEKPAETIGDVTITEADNRVRLGFPGKPAAEIIALLKRNGFRWSPTNSAWQRQATVTAWNAARSVATAAGRAAA